MSSKVVDITLDGDPITIDVPDQPRCYCGNPVLEFQGRWLRYCSRECQHGAAAHRYHTRRANRRLRLCAVCTKPINDLRKRKYCSQLCYLTANQDAAKALIEPRKSVERTCRGCKAVFTTGIRNKIYCSPRCTEHSKYISKRNWEIRGKEAVTSKDQAAMYRLNGEVTFVDAIQVFQEMTGEPFQWRTNDRASAKTRSKHRQAWTGLDKEWSETINWAKTWPSDEMFSVFHGGMIRKSEATREPEASELENRLRDSMPWVLTERPHQGETVQEWRDRGGVIKPCPPCNAGIGMFVDPAPQPRPGEYYNRFLRQWSNNKKEEL